MMRFVAATAFTLVVAATIGGQVRHPPTAAGRRPPQPAPGGPEASDRGAVEAGYVVQLTLGLATRNQGHLAALIAAGVRVDPARYASEFGPLPAAVGAVVDQLGAAGLAATWTPGSTVLTTSGPASAVERVFSIQLHRFWRGDGTSYVAAQGRPALAGALAATVTSVAGLDDSATFHTLAGRQASGSSGNGGYSPDQVLGAYHVGPLRDGGLRGAGQTIVFLEIDGFSQADLNTYTDTFGQSRMAVEVATHGQYGRPTAPMGEANMDLEIAHSMAPGARLVVFFSDPSAAHAVTAFADATQRYPNAIISISLGRCATDVRPEAQVFDTVAQRFAGIGRGSVFVSSGDHGAFECGVGPFGTLSPSTSSPADDPYITSVGGTTLFVGQGNSYGSEAGWGSPIRQVGAGGGLSVLWDRPSYQKGPGVETAASNGRRQLPDVGALSDSVTGWALRTQGTWEKGAGTSAAAPLWAGLAALLNEAASRHRERPIGFANPVLYDLASQAASLPAPPFHDVTLGDNLYYPAAPGWDFVTGLGTPDASGLVDDYLHYALGK